MGRIKKAVQLTENPHLNLYELETQDRKGHPGCYYVASRAKHTEDLELVRKQQKPDGVIIYSLYGEKRDKVVLVRQYRYPIDGYLYEFPAGLVEPGEDYHDAAVREMKEETGLDLQPIPVDNFYAKPYYTTIGMTDECCATVYGIRWHGQPRWPGGHRRSGSSDRRPGRGTPNLKGRTCGDRLLLYADAFSA